MLTVDFPGQKARTWSIPPTAANDSSSRFSDDADRSWPPSRGKLSVDELYETQWALSRDPRRAERGTFPRGSVERTGPTAARAGLRLCGEQPKAGA